MADDGYSNAIEDLKGDRPKIFGFDYYRVIYVTCSALMVSMGFVYFTVENDEVAMMVLVQGGLSLALMATLVWYRGLIEKRRIERLEAAERRKYD